MAGKIRNAPGSQNIKEKHLHSVPRHQSPTSKDNLKDNFKSLSKNVQIEAVKKELKEDGREEGRWKTEQKEGWGLLSALLPQPSFGQVSAVCLALC